MSKLHRASEEPGSDREKPGLREVFDAAGLLVSFDAETGMLPCRHDQLLQEFAAATASKFRPEAVTEQWLQKNDRHDDAPYMLRFVHGGRAFEAKMRNRGDWYDVERVVQVLNVALAAAGIAERFTPLMPDGQIAEFVFADPSKLQAIAKKLQLPLSADPDEARKQGVEFERRALELIRKGK